MCGLSGVMSSTVAHTEESMWRELMVVSTLRGYQGSGVIVSQKKWGQNAGNVRSFKAQCNAVDLVHSSPVEDLLRPAVNAIIGHARWPTKGGSDIKAVHPHRHNHIIGVHNGTMYRVGGQTVGDKSDSAMLFQSIAEQGIKKTIEESQGAYALVWIDMKERTINFLRNAQRTLFFRNVGWQNNVSTLFWSSEREMLDFVFARSFRGNNSWDTYLPEHMLYKYPLDVEFMINPVEVIKDLKPKPVTYTQSTRGTQTSGRYRGGMFGSEYGDWSQDDWDAWLKRRDQEAEDAKGNPFDMEDQRPIALPAPQDNKVVDIKDRAQKNKRMSRKDLRRIAAEARAKKKKEDEAQAATFRQLKDIGPAMRELHEHMEKSSDVPSGDRYIKAGGRDCAWCGTMAHSGDEVYPVEHSDLGSGNTFICVDCGDNNDVAKEFVASSKKTVVI